jgi:hypothetical protein
MKTATLCEECGRPDILSSELSGVGTGAGGTVVGAAGAVGKVVPEGVAVAFAWDGNGDVGGGVCDRDRGT